MFRMVFVLAVTGMLAGVLLAIVNRVTREPIARAMREEKMKAMRMVLPEHDNDPMTCVATVVEDGKSWVFHVAKKDGKFAGAAFEASSGEGYSGVIKIMAGVGSDNALRGIEILQHAETPGLGARIVEGAFRDQFKGLDIVTTDWRVKKEGGDIDAITGATISPSAVLDALRAGLAVYIRNKDRIQDCAE